MRGNGRWLVLAIAVLANISACATSAVLVGPRPPASYETIGPAEGSACGAIVGPRLLILGVDLIPIKLNGRTERAYAEALGERGTALLDTRIRERRYPLFVGQLLCIDIQGTAIRETEPEKAKP